MPLSVCCCSQTFGIKKRLCGSTRHTSCHCDASCSTRSRYFWRLTVTAQSSDIREPSHRYKLPMDYTSAMEAGDVLHGHGSETCTSRLVIHPPSHMMFQIVTFISVSSLRLVFCCALFISFRLLADKVKVDKTKPRMKERIRPTVNTSSVILSLPFMLQTHMAISVAALLLGLLFESFQFVNVASSEKTDLIRIKRRKEQLYWGALESSWMQEWSTSGSSFGPRRVRLLPSICEIGEE